MIKEKLLSTLSRIQRVFWRSETAVWAGIVAVVVGLGVFFTVIPDMSAQQEIDAATRTTRSITTDAVHAPYVLVNDVISSVSNSIRAHRALSFSVFLGMTVIFYFMLRHWHSRQVALLTTLFFATNAVVLAISRSATPLVISMLWFTWYGIILLQIHRPTRFPIYPALSVVGLAFLLYTPGAPYMLLLGAAFFFNKITEPLRDISWKVRSMLLAALLVGITPLIISFVQTPDSLKEWFLLPDAFSLAEIGRNFLRLPSAFFYRMPVEPLLNVGRLPVFDIVAGLLLVVGANAYRQKLSLDRTRLMIIGAVAGVVFAALGQIILAVCMLLPFVFAIIAAGAEYLLDQWYGVFPRNQYARSFGLIILSTVILFGVYYQLTRFLVVWPQAPETRETYSLPRNIESTPQADTIIE